MNDTVLYIIRHADSCPSSNFNIITLSDDENLIAAKNILSVSGEVKSKALAELPELKNLDAVYSSSYVRALGTAKYIASNNNTIINIDERLNERKVGKLGKMSVNEFETMQMKDFDFKLNNGESLNETKKRVVEAIKNILMYEPGGRVAVVMHSTAITCLMSAWCKVGYNFDGQTILSYEEEPIIDGEWTAPQMFEVVFDGMEVKSIRKVDLKLN